MRPASTTVGISADANGIVRPGARRRACADEQREDGDQRGRGGACARIGSRDRDQSSRQGSVSDRPLGSAGGLERETRYPGTLPATWLAARMAVDPAHIDVLRRAGELIAVREPGSTEWRYPAWQFENGQPRGGIARIVGSARERGLDDASSTS